MTLLITWEKIFPFKIKQTFRPELEYRLSSILVKVSCDVILFIKPQWTLWSQLRCKTKYPIPGRCGSAGWASSHKAKGYQFDSWSPVGVHARGNWSMSLSHISVSLPLFLPYFPSLWNQLKEKKQTLIISENQSPFTECLFCGRPQSHQFTYTVTFPLIFTPALWHRYYPHSPLRKQTQKISSDLSISARAGFKSQICLISWHHFPHPSLKSYQELVNVR